MADYQEVEVSFGDDSVKRFFVIKLWRQNVLVLTKEELERGLRRGKWYRRRQAREARLRKECYD